MPSWPDTLRSPGIPSDATNLILDGRSRQSSHHEQTPKTNSSRQTKKDRVRRTNPSRAVRLRFSLANHKDKDRNAQTICILILFGRQSTVLASVDGALRLQPGEIAHQGSGQSDV